MTVPTPEVAIATAAVLPDRIHKESGGLRMGLKGRAAMSGPRSRAVGPGDDEIVTVTKAEEGTSRLCPRPLFGLALDQGKGPLVKPHDFRAHLQRGHPG